MVLLALLSGRCKPSDVAQARVSILNSILFFASVVPSVCCIEYCVIMPGYMNWLE